MIKRLLSVCVIATAFTGVNAQITITVADIAGIGKVIRSANDTMPTVIPGPAGANVTWNFTALNNHSVDTLTFTNPNWTPDGNQFPTSNLAVLQGTNGTVYTQVTGTDFFIQGQAGNLNQTAVVVKNNPFDELITFPSTFNTSFNNTTAYDLRVAYTQQTGIDSVRVKHNATSTSKINAWGTVTTPLLSNQPCIRQRKYTHNTDTIFAHLIFPPGWQVIQATEDSSVHFDWWANGIGFPLVGMDSMFDGTITGVSWLLAQPTNSGISEYSSVKSLDAYPNPASDVITFDLRDMDASVILVNDVTGREVLSLNVTGSVFGTDVSNLSNGSYLYNVMDRNGLIVGRGKFVVTK